MGKRSNFPRNANDLYPTPHAAVLPLIPWLRGVRTFAEPCCGNGDLVRHLESHGLRCVYAGDINDGRDALALEQYGDVDSIITNSPWTRSVLHPLIRHFARIAPTWLLIDQDWACTKQAIPFLTSCTDILPIGRQIWIPGTNTHGFDNAAWYRFDARHAAGPVFHAYRSAPASVRAVLCGHCGQTYWPQRSSSQFCSAACRQGSYRARVSVTLSVTPGGAS